MPRVDLLGPSLELPDGWRGVSFAFIAPPAPAEKNVVPMLNPGVSFRETITVAIEPVPKGTTPAMYHQAQLAQLEAQLPNVKVASKTEKEHRGHPALIVELELGGPRNERLRQLQLISVANGEICAAMATTIDGPGYPNAKNRLLRVLESLDF